MMTIWVVPLMWDRWRKKHFYYTAFPDVSSLVNLKRDFCITAFCRWCSFAELIKLEPYCAPGLFGGGCVLNSESKATVVIGPFDPG